MSAERCVVMPDVDPTPPVKADGSYVSTVWLAQWNGGNFLASLFQMRGPGCCWMLRYRFKSPEGASRWCATFVAGTREDEARRVAHATLSEAMQLFDGAKLSMFHMRTAEPAQLRRKLAAVPGFNIEVVPLSVRS